MTSKAKQTETGGETQGEPTACDPVPEDDFEAMLAEIEGMSDDEAQALRGVFRSLCHTVVRPATSTFPGHS